DEVNSRKTNIFYDCNDNSKHDQFDLTIPKFCNIKESNLWHMELKKVYHFHGNNHSCTSSLEILMVSKNFTMLLTSNFNKVENILLLDYIESDNYNIPACIPKNKKYYQFNYNIFVDVEKNFEWKNVNTNKERLIEKSSTEIISFHYNNELNKNVLLLGMESFIETKYELDFSNIATTFKLVTDITLSNELVENKESYNKAAGKIKSRIDELGEMLYKEACNTRNEKIKHFNDKETSDEKVRQFLGREGIKAQEFEQNRKYIISQCEEVIPKMIYEKRSIDNICYKLKPVIIGRSTLMFADEKNYLHHFSESRTCHSLIDFDHVLETFDHIRMGFIETCFNSIFGGINSTFEGLSMGWINSTDDEIIEILEENNVQIEVIIKNNQIDYIYDCNKFNVHLYNEFEYPLSINISEKGFNEFTTSNKIKGDGLCAFHFTFLSKKMKYLFIIVAVVLALITENGIFAKSTNCHSECTKNGKKVSCEGPEFDKIMVVKLCNEKDCQKVCAKKSKKGSCKKTAKVLHNQILNECLCQ
uniref:Uncharacterized protein n=1 Tax=Strongyloides stercoralis TaxID=6248 RepID=A0AAF5DMV0_STRER